jgi:hypothetical protein
VLLAQVGALTYAAWEGAVLEALAHIPPGGVRRVLSDRRQLEGTYPAGMMDQIVQFMREHAQELGDLQWAAVAADDPETVATLRRGEQLLRGTRVQAKVFTELGAALRWLLGVYEEEDLVRLERWVEAEG